MPHLTVAALVGAQECAAREDGRARELLRRIGVFTGAAALAIVERLRGAAVVTVLRQ